MEFLPGDFSGQGTSGTGSAISATENGVTFACDKGYGTTQFRCYSGGKITISSSNTITAISFTFSGSYKGGLESSYTNLDTKFWEKALSSQARITKCVVTYEEASTDPYTVTFHTTATSETELTEDAAGAGVTPPTMEKECGDWTFQGWSKLYSDSETSTTELELVTLTDKKYYPTEDVNLYPVYTQTTSTGGTAFDKYTQVSLGGTITSGKYLISTGLYTMAGNGKTGVSFSPGSTEKTAYEYTITIDGSYFTIKGPDEKYVGGGSSTTLTFNASVQNDTYRWSYVEAGIQNKTHTTRRIRANGSTDFRHYANSNGTTTYLYKRTEKSSGSTYYYSYPQCATQTVVTLNPNEGTGGTTEVTATYGQPMPAITIPTRTGYDFQGYFTANDGTGTQYYNANGTSAKDWDKEDATFTLYAYWIAKTYTVTLDNQGATTAGATSVTATYNAAMPSIASNLPEKTGYTFNGYFDATSGGTKYYNADGTSAKNWDKTANTTLYAQWTSNKTATSLSWSAATYSATIDADNTFPELTKSPADLTGITYSSLDETVATIDANGNITLLKKGETTITATFEETPTHTGVTASYTLTVNPSNCRWVEVTDNTTLEDGDWVVITMTKGLITWALNQDYYNSGDKYPLATTLEVNGNEITPISDKIKWNISGNATDGYILYPNGQTSTWLYCTGSNNTIKIGGGSPKHFVIENGYLKSKSKVTTSGVEVDAFLGVSPSTDSWRHYPNTTTSVISGQTLKFYKRECLDATNYWVTWDAGEGAWEDKSSKKIESYTVGAAITKPENPTREGYRFDGWTPALTTMPAQNTTFTAKWTSAVYTINYKDQGDVAFSGTHAEGHPTTHTYNTATTLKSASKDHYTFGGWYKESNCSGTAVTTLGATEYTNDITLYAQWTAKTYTITLDANGGTFVDKRDSQTKGSATFDYIYGTYATYSDAPNLTEYYTDLKRDGYQFDKWVSAGSPWNKLFTSTGDRTIQAQWSKLYTITLYENDTEIKLTPQTSTSYTLPNELSAGSCQDDTKELVGWSTVAIPNPGDMPTSKFYELGETVTLSEDKTTFYAVFATPTTIPGGTEEKEVTVTVNISEYATANSWINGTQYNTVNIDDNITAIASGDGNTGKYYTTGTNWRLYYSENATLTIEAKDGIIINSLKITYVSEKNGVLLNNGEQIFSGEECIVNAESVQFKTGLSSGTESGQVRITKMEVTYTTTVQADDIVTYSNYSTTCVPAPKLVSIAQTAGQIEFTEGDEFVKATITATYEDESTKDVTSKATFSTPDMTQVGEKTISVSYKEGEVTAETSYKINIKEKPKYTINWWANGEKYHTQTAVEGTAIDVPASSDVATYACDDKVFVGWVDTEIIGSIDTKPTLITDFDKITENKDFFAVFATRCSSEPTAYTAGEVGDFVLAAKNSDKWYALPTNPTINSGKIQGVEIPVTTTNGVEHVTTANALGYTWTIANATNGQTISDGSKYIYHSNGGVDGTNLTYGIGTSFTWKIEKEDAGLTFKAMNGTTVNNRGMLMQGTQYGGYSLTNETTNGYYRISVLPIADAVSYSGYVTTCEKPIYTRVVKPGEYGTICLPYGSSDYTGAEFYEVSSVEYGKGLWLDQLAAGTALAAGKPYIFRAIAEKLAVVYKGEKKDSPVGGVNGLTGTFTAIAANSTLVGHYIIALNQIWVANDKNTLPAYRAYIDKDGVPTTEQPKLAGRRRVCMGENAATGLDNITNGENTTIKVIENGQLIIIRNGEKFNAQGQKL